MWYSFLSIIISGFLVLLVGFIIRSSLDIRKTQAWIRKEEMDLKKLQQKRQKMHGEFE